MAKKITILIDEDGNCQIEGHDFHGPECEHVIREIEQALGTRTHVQYKPEYRQAQRNQQTQRG